MRYIIALACAAAAVFCVFGFLATFEPPGWPLARMVYAIVGVVFLVGAGWALFRRTTA